MRTILNLMIITIIAFSCNQKQQENKQNTPVKDETLVEVKDGVYTEWYAGKKQIKYKGELDKENKRNGKWTFYTESGLENSITFYKNGARDGFTIVKYPNGVVHYRGEYQNNEMVGVWTTFNEKGKTIEEKDYGYPK